MLSHIAKHIAKKNIIINVQHGFRNKLSTIMQLINTTIDWANTLNNKGQTDIIFFDFSKAFDKISHKFILSKLHYYGIRNHTLSWIGVFLSSHTQTAVVNGVNSSYVEVTSGVPLMWKSCGINQCQSSLKLNINKSPDNNGLQAEHIKYAPKCVHQDIENLLNEVAETGTYPKELKHELIITKRES